MENIVIFYDHLEYFMAIWYNLWQFVIVYLHMVIWYIFLILDQNKSGNPACFRRYLPHLIQSVSIHTF
jgi:hypothetical protein